MKKTFCLPLMIGAVLSLPSCRHREADKAVSGAAVGQSVAGICSFDLSSAVVKDTSVLINGIVDSFEYIPLEFNLDASLQLEYLMTAETENGLLVSNNCARWFRGVFLFGKSGDFKSTLIGLGHGHNELSPDFYGWAYDRYKGELLMLGRGICYVFNCRSNEGRLLKADDAFMDIVPTDGDVYLVRPASASKEGNPFLKLVSGKGTAVKEFRYENKMSVYYEVPTADFGPNEHRLLKQGGSGEALFKDMFNDTIYVLEHDVLHPRYCLETGSKRPNVKDVLNKKKKAGQIYLSDIATAGDYLLCQYEYAGEPFNQLVFEISTGKVVAASHFGLDMRGAGTVHAFRNRFPFQLQTPTGHVIWMGMTAVGESILYGVVNPSDVSDFLEVDADSNPVLVKMYLK